jgi:hypothetical protein
MIDRAVVKCRLAIWSTGTPSVVFSNDPCG